LKQILRDTVAEHLIARWGAMEASYREVIVKEHA
jgi:hypothetical protein